MKKKIIMGIAILAVLCMSIGLTALATQTSFRPVKDLAGQPTPSGDAGGSRKPFNIRFLGDEGGPGKPFNCTL